MSGHAVDIKEEADKGDQNHESNPAPFVQDIFQLQPCQSEVDQSERIKEENIIKEGVVGDPAHKERCAGAEPISQEDGRSDEKEKEGSQPCSVTEKADRSQAPKITGQVFDSFL